MRCKWGVEDGRVRAGVTPLLLLVSLELCLRVQTVCWRGAVCGSERFCLATWMGARLNILCDEMIRKAALHLVKEFVV